MMSTAPLKMLGNSDFSVVEFNILGDTKAVVEAGIKIAFQQHKKFTHFRVIEKNGGDANELHLCWTDGPGNQELPFSLQTVEAAHMFISSWVSEKGKFNEETYWAGDGSNNRGVRLTNEYPELYEDRTPYLALRVMPEYVYYGK